MYGTTAAIWGTWRTAESAKKSEGQAAWGRNCGYHYRKVASSSSLRTLVRVRSKSCAPRSDRCICCFLTSCLRPG